MLYGGTIKYAVKGLSLGIPKGECFGLLGVNGQCITLFIIESHLI